MPSPRIRSCRAVRVGKGPPSLKSIPGRWVAPPMIDADPGRRVWSGARDQTPACTRSGVRTNPTRRPCCRALSERGDLLVALPVFQHVGPRRGGVVEEPVDAVLAVELVDRLLGVDGERVEEVRAVPAAGRGS